MGSPTQTTPNTTSLHPTMLTWWLLTFSLTVQLTLTSPAIREEETSAFQNAVQHCCTSTTTSTPHRCFEVNEFAGVNFVRSPCRFLKSVEKKTQMDPEDKLIETRQRKKIEWSLSSKLLYKIAAITSRAKPPTDVSRSTKGIVVQHQRSLSSRSLSMLVEQHEQF